MKDEVYTAIPKFLTYANLTIGSYVENRGYAANTPWQYTYAMGDRVDYDGLKESLHALLTSSDAVWVFGAYADTFPRHEAAVYGDIAVTDGVEREIHLAFEHDIPVQIYYVNPETLGIARYGYVERTPGTEIDDAGERYLGEWGGSTLYFVKDSDVLALLDDVEVRGYRADGESRQTLHRHDDICSYGDRMEDPDVFTLGEDIEHAHHYDFCRTCEWDYPYDLRVEALKA